MTQDRRKREERSTEQVDWSEADDTASQSQAVPSELVSLKKLALAATAGPWIFTKYGNVMDGEKIFEIVPADTMREDREYIAAANPAAILKLIEQVESLSHSAATGKVPEVVREAVEAAFEERKGWRVKIAEAVRALASPAAPLAGKAEPSKQTDGWPDEIYLQAGDEPLGHFSEYDEVSWCDHPQGESDVRYVRADAPLAAAVPAEEAGDVQRDATKVLQQAADALRNSAPIYVSGKSSEDHNRAFVAVCELLEAARLSKPTAQGTVQSIDTDEFHVFMNEYDNEASYGSINKARTELVKFINRHIAAQAPAGRDAVLEEAAKLCDDMYAARATQGFPREASTARALREAIRALKGAAPHAAEQASGGA